MASQSLPDFLFKGKSVRTIEVSGQPWFSSKDVVKVLGLKWSGSTLKGIKTSWKGMSSYDTPRGKQRISIVSEPALYKLAFRSNKPDAEDFTDQVAEFLTRFRRGEVAVKVSAEEKILEMFVTRIPTGNSPIFPDELYKQFARLYEYPYVKGRSPGFVGTKTREWIYGRLAPFVGKEILDLAPRDDKGRLKVHLHQYLTPEIGKPQLEQMLHTVIGFMKVARSPEHMEQMLQAAYPLPNEQLILSLIHDPMEAAA
jgi:hypothetical protein